MPTPREATLPIDTSVKVPEAVRRSSLAADSAFNTAYQPETPAPAPAPAPTPAAAAPAATPEPQPAPQPQPQPQPAAPVAPSIPETGGPESFEGRYKAMQGRFNQAVERITQLEGMLATMQAPPSTPALPSPPPELKAASLVTKEEREAYGEDFLDVVARRAMEAVSPQIAAKEQEIQELKQQLHGVTGVINHDARSRMMQQLADAVPHWEQLNTDQNFLGWLRLPDVFSGVTRQSLLSQAFERNDTNRVLAFFKGFLKEEAAVGPTPTPELPAPDAAKPGLEQFAAPGKGKGSAVPRGTGAEQKPIITRQEIAAFYADVTAGKYVRNEAEKTRLEAMIWDAQKEGRIR